MTVTTSKIFAGFIALAVAFTLASCGGVSNSTTGQSSNVTVSLNQSSMNVAVGATAQFTATVQNTTNTAVTWSVDGVAGGNATAGTISASGLYTAPAAAGSHKVTATSVADTNASASAAVTVGALAAISPATAFLPPGGTQQFSSSIQGFSNTSVNWAVNQVAGGNASVGTITAAGLYTAPLQPGTYAVTATSAADSSVTASAAVTVGTIKLSPTSATLASSQMQQFTPTASAGVTTFTWSVDGTVGGNATVGTISVSGLYMAPVQAGSHTVTAADGSITGSASVSIVDFTIAPSSTTVAPSTTKQFTATIEGLSNQAVTWAVDGTTGGSAATGTVSAGGLYTAPAAIGAHIISATSVADTALTASASVTVINFSQASVLTYHNDDARDGQYLEEVSLTPSNVNSSTFGKLLAYPVDGQVYAQPLYMPGLSIAGGTHDVVFVVTQNNSVYAFDADATSSATAQTFWHAGPLGPSVYKGDITGVNPNVGILSTPVIDASTNTMYLVAEEGGKSDPTPFFLHALDVTTGAEKFGGPVNITGSVAGTGLDSSGGNISLESDCYQRMGLALNPVTNWIYIPFGSCNHGWILAYDKTSLAQEAIFNDTPDGAGGGYWASGGAPAIDDATGYVYLMSGVDELVAGDPGTGDPVTNGYNDSIFQLDATNLSISSYFTPSDNFTLAEWDADLGSGSNILVPSTPSLPVTLGGGKDGNVFVVNRNNMGGYNPGGTNNVVQQLQICTDGYNNIFSTPAYWVGTGSIYFHCNDNVISAYSWNASTAQIATSPTSVGSAVFKTHGATPSLSANGAVNGIIWDIDNSAYSYSLGVPQGPSVLHAYDATNVGSELYNSSQAGTRDTAGSALKFTVPTIAGGKVFVPTSTELDVYGLLP
ncbi:MAG: hypothetical protein WBW36_11635 [Candidatus Sulfotelmatobacter sp.]